MRMTTKAKRIVADLFAAFYDEPRLLPLDTRPAWRRTARAPSRTTSPA